LLDKYPDADVRVYAVWFSMYPTDARDRWPGDVLTDRRVVHWWNEDRRVGRWYAPRMRAMADRLAAGSEGMGGAILWDAYLVYGRDAEWTDAPSGLRRWGRPIFATREPFSETVGNLVKANARASSN
jgi:hypothetical protein